METATHLSYDQVPYNSSAFQLTHPAHLATIPILFGMAPPTVRKCRVLELGCASGGNLIPMAQNLPDATFLGIDLSARQIAEGQAQLDQLPISNIELRHQSILDVDETFGEFDYIICHGVYSWVPEQVREKILHIGRENLGADGILYVSYNTYPGWHMRGVVRDMMRYHAAPFDEPQTKIDQARALLDFLTRSAASRSEAYQMVLQDEAKIVGAHADSYLFHEHLEEENKPLYFYQFVEQAEDAGLQYLGEAEFATMLADNFAPDTAAILQDASLIRQEQYMDFLRNRMFRSTLLCKKEIKLDRHIDPARLMQLSLALDVRFELPSLDPTSNEPVSCRGPNQESFQVEAPITKAALLILNESYPRSIAFESLLGQAWTRTGLSTKSVTDDERLGHRTRLAEDLMTLLTRSLLQATVDPPTLVRQVGQYPQTTALARWQAENASSVTTRRHEQIRLHDLPRELLIHCDGKHDRQALANLLESAFQRGEFEVQRDKKPLAHVERSTVLEILDSTLEELANHSLLISAQ